MKTLNSASSARRNRNSTYRKRSAAGHHPSASVGAKGRSCPPACHAANPSIYLILKRVLLLLVWVMELTQSPMLITAPQRACRPRTVISSAAALRQISAIGPSGSAKTTGWPASECSRIALWSDLTQQRNLVARLAAHHLPAEERLHVPAPVQTWAAIFSISPSTGTSTF